MNGEYIAAIGTVLASCIAGFAAIKAAKAEKNTRATSNGFAGSVLGSLSRIETRIDHHIDNHNH